MNFSPHQDARLHRTASIESRKYSTHSLSEKPLSSSDARSLFTLLRGRLARPQSPGDPAFERGAVTVSPDFADAGAVEVLDLYIYDVCFGFCESAAYGLDNEVRQPASATVCAV